MSEPARRVLRRMVPSYLNGKGDRVERKEEGHDAAPVA